MAITPIPTSLAEASAIAARLESIYTPPVEAAAELLIRQVPAKHSSQHPLLQYLCSRPFAVLSRNISTPNFELHRFVSLARSIGLTPLVLEFRRDRFVTNNLLKLALARLAFSAEPHMPTQPAVTSIVHLPTAIGLPLNQVTTTWGQPLLEFHRELLSAAGSFPALNSYDSSDWFAMQLTGAQSFYHQFLSLFVSHGVLFESFLLTSDERDFTANVVIPAFFAAHSICGLQPLICRLDPPESEGEAHWLRYPASYREFVCKRLGTTSTKDSSAEPCD